MMAHTKAMKMAFHSSKETNINVMIIIKKLKEGFIPSKVIMEWRQWDTSSNISKHNSSQGSGQP